MAMFEPLLDLLREEERIFLLEDMADRGSRIAQVSLRTGVKFINEAIHSDGFSIELHLKNKESVTSFTNSLEYCFCKECRESLTRVWMDAREQDYSAFGWGRLQGSHFLNYTTAVKEWAESKKSADTGTLKSGQLG